MRLQADIGELALIWRCLVALIGNEAQAPTSGDTGNQADQSPFHVMIEGRPIRLLITNHFVMRHQQGGPMSIA